MPRPLSCPGVSGGRVASCLLDVGRLCFAACSRRVGKQSGHNLLQKLTKQQCGPKAAALCVQWLTHTHTQPPLDLVVLQDPCPAAAVTIELPVRKALNKYLLCSAGIFQHKAQHTHVYTRTPDP